MGPSNFNSLLQEWQIMRNASITSQETNDEISTSHFAFFFAFRISLFAFLLVLCSLFTAGTLREQGERYVHNQNF